MTDSAQVALRLPPESAPLACERCGDAAEKEHNPVRRLTFPYHAITDSKDTANR